MARVRVFLLTHRRPVLLRRALRSLLGQTFSDWICELHNDAPGDESPRQVLDEITCGDSRFSYHPHADNWGAVQNFNHAFQGGPHPYASLLEDDNWWEPTFLDEALRVLTTQPEIEMVWANQKIWQEMSDGEWRDTGKTVWPISAASEVIPLFRWPVLLQSYDALHANGAMIFRTSEDSTTVPSETPFAIIEHARERIFRGSLALLPAPLAHYALTQSTARETDRTAVLQGQLLITASFLATVPLTDSEIEALWEELRTQQPPSTPILFLAALSGVQSWRILRQARLSDWAHFLPQGLVRLGINFRALQFRKAFPGVWQWLCRESEARTKEAFDRGCRCSPLVRKQLP